MKIKRREVDVALVLHYHCDPVPPRSTHVYDGGSVMLPIMTTAAVFIYLFIFYTRVPSSACSRISSAVDDPVRGSQGSQRLRPAIKRIRIAEKVLRKQSG
jgi:hypothetical protein